MLTLELPFYTFEIPNASLLNIQSRSVWLFTTQSRVLQADWLILGNNEKATVNFNVPHCSDYLEENSIVALHCSSVGTTTKFPLALQMCWVQHEHDEVNYFHFFPLQHDFTMDTTHL